MILDFISLSAINISTASPQWALQKTIMCTPREGAECRLVRREGNYAHAHYTDTEHTPFLADVIYVRFISPVLQVSSVMFSVHGIQCKVLPALPI